MLELVANLGVNGFTSRDVIEEELPKLSGLDPGFASILVGVNTIMIPILPDACTGDLCGFKWFIAWDSGLPEGEFLDNAVFLFRQICEGEFCGPIEPFGDPATNVVFFATPEPGPLALLIGALAAGWIVRRRRTAA